MEGNSSNGGGAVRKLSWSAPASKQAAPPPPWLQSVLEDQTPAPKLYAWTPENLPRNEIRNKYESIVRDGYTVPASHPKRVHVLGLGNLGRLFATALAANQTPVTLVVHRRDLLEHWAADPGIHLTRPDGSLLSAPAGAFDIEWWTAEPPREGLVREVADGGAVENLIVATKAQAAIPQVDKLRRYLDDTSAVLFVQNGVSPLWPPHGPVYNKARYVDGKNPSWLLGVTMHGVYSQGLFRSVFASPADVAIGPVEPSRTGTDGSARYLTQQLLTAPYLAARAVPRAEVWVMQLEKLVVNSIINPLTAILRCRNSGLFCHPAAEVVRVIDLLVEETSRVLQLLVQDERSAQGILQSSSATGGGADTTRQQDLLERFSAPNLKAMLDRVGEKVKDNFSSMFQDATAGKGTEIREFNGWLLETAAYLDTNLDMAAHRTLVELVESGIVLEPPDLGRYFPAPRTAEGSTE